ncbi:glycan metabolism protein [Pedobacter psychrophilus]|uniref:Glycan metabolism protein n=1 Tax=Pedobacter psychrophilus TaxID=1826909 RepID=A0A179DM82_9SPHI|nr:RagB/SusD family nutrient uptake outer membrane protein [Pedobacter psychrophilus]OAQ42014.1 glycan metabolism protein [Pedobacter psychrophilus]
MKNYKKLFVIVFFSVICFTNNSCKKDITQFLEKAPGVDINENTIFSSRQQLDIFLATIYKFGLPSILAYRDASLSATGTIVDSDVIHPISSSSDESDASQASFINANRWNEGAILPSNIIAREDYRFYTRFIALRQIAIMLKRIDEVPDIDINYKNQVIAEVKSIRAFLYLEMVKRYGGMPIIEDTFEPGVAVQIPRNSLEENINFIVKDCNEAIALNSLPAQQSAALTGRITKLVPMAIKSRALLYAASPLFNTATPYLPMNNAADNKFICYGNYDVNRWKLAADAAKAVLDEAALINVRLINDPANTKGRYPNLDIDPSTNAIYALGKAPVPGNYEKSWTDYNNSEIILAFQGYPAANYANNPWRFIAPTSTGVTWSGLSVTLNHVSKYEKMIDGTPQTWEATGGADLMSKYRELDPRFKQSIAYTTSYFNATNSNMSIFAGVAAEANCFGGNWMRKPIPFTIRNGGSPATVPNDIILRLNEFYLNYAEALNEFSGPSTETYTAVNTIRSRSGMPNLPANLSQLQFQTRVRNERAVELAFDSHRFWDVRRWLIAEQEGIMNGAMRGLQITRNGTSPNFTYSWTPYTFETRLFNKNLYLHPLPLSEVLKGQLVQNPGW